MPPLPQILARSGEDSFIKMIFGIIVLIIWLGGALMSALQKRAEEAKRRARNQMPAGYTRPVPPPAQNPAGFPAPPAKAKSKRAAKRQAVSKPLPSVPIVRQATTPAAPPVAAPARSTPVAQPSQIARLLRRPDSLRAALILNEVLSPPVALREHSKSGQHV